MLFCFMSEMLAVMSELLGHLRLQVFETILFGAINAIGLRGFERIGFMTQRVGGYIHIYIYTYIHIYIYTYIHIYIYGFELAQI
jgi:hypothetical protein